MQRLVRRAAIGSGEPGLDLICTKVAVDLQTINANTADERIRSGMQALVDACKADSVFVALLDEDSQTFRKVYAGRSMFSAVNPEVLQSAALRR